jgi:hypothetical protein
LAVLVAGLIVVSACTSESDAAAQHQQTTTTEQTTSTTTTTAPSPEPSQPSSPTTTTAPDPFARPDGLGTRPLPLRPDGLGEIRATPPDLVDRRFASPRELPPPPDDGFHHTNTPVPDDVLARSTWRPECPVGLGDLRYLTVSYWGFDGRHYTGELIVNASVADDVVGVFARLHEVRFPIEELRVTRADELDAAPTGDGNLSGGFVCRDAALSDDWSEHARGLAVDINPFHNPFVRGDAVIPELASAYLDRGNLRPGMIMPGDVVTRAFADIGWGWGGNWRNSKDWMHFSASGR